MSDVYVRLGYEFNIACRAFSAINVETNDLGNVPEELRHILESTLSQEASVESLDKYLPKIRDIIIGLLHGLKRKQQKLRQKQNVSGDGVLPRQTSVSSTGSGSTGLTTLMNEALPSAYREDSYRGSQFAALPSSNEAQALPPPRQSSQSNNSPRRPNGSVRDSRTSTASAQSSLSSTTAQNMPILGPEDEIPQQQTVPSVSSDSSIVRSDSSIDVDSFPPPPPPKQTQNALAALQRGGDLERRASRRYSAYQISKHLGATPGGIPMMPPVQNSPIPNRGRDARESMNAVRGRASIHDRQKSSQRIDTNATLPRSTSRISEASEASELEGPAVPTHAELAQDDNSVPPTPEEMVRKEPFAKDVVDRIMSGTLNGPPEDAMPVPFSEDFDETAMKEQEAIVEVAQVQSQPDVQAVPKTQSGPGPSSDLTLFLQYKTKIKKFVLEGGHDGLSMARLQLAFIEKFAWNTYNNGADLPEIYIQDPVSGVRHELEDMSDIKDRSVLVLNVEVLDEVKRHIDEGIGNLKTSIESVVTQLEEQKTSLKLVAERQQDAAAKEVSRPPLSARSQSTRGSGFNFRGDSNAQLTEIATLRQDLAVLRQTYSAFQADVETSMNAIRTKATSVKDLADTAASVDGLEVHKIPGVSGRVHISQSKKTLNDDADRLVSRVDDLQDIVEDLRKDVVTRGVRPLPRQLETLAKDIATATLDLSRMQDYLRKEEPIWKEIMETELQSICDDKEELSMQRELVADLQDDLEKASQTFALVEEATKEQLKDSASGGMTPTRLPKLNHVVADPIRAKEGVLGEVRALQPNHETRLEAIERAEKARQVELQSRPGGVFKQELGDFVAKGKLKKSGGYEEVERRRIAREEKTRREVYEAMNGMSGGGGDEDFEEEEEEDEDGEEYEEEDEEDEENNGEEAETDDETLAGEETGEDSALSVDETTLDPHAIEDLATPTPPGGF